MQSLQVFFSGWPSLARVVLVGVPLYFLLLLMLQWFGKHALAKSNAYGLVVTVSLGSAVASAVLTKEVSLADAVVAIGLLLALQYALELAGSRTAWGGRLLDQSPALLLRNGQMLHEAMRRERVSESEVLAAIRRHGIGCVEQVGAVVLEEDGSFSVIPDLGPAPTALSNVHDAQAHGPAFDRRPSPQPQADRRRPRPPRHSAWHL
jgi:uncharacterized membrane protein YcaP (DUF421 family)